MFNKSLPFIILLSILCSCPLLPINKNSVVEKEIFRQQIEQVDCDGRDRLEGVQKIFAESGAKPKEIVVERYEKVENVVVTLNGRTNETVIVSAHYDKTTRGCGAIDNWTGVIIIANLYRILKTRNNKKTYKFVAFGKEEKGLIGSKTMVKTIPQSHVKNYCAMINFDSFGFTDLWALGSISDDKLIELGRVVAKDRNTEFLIKNFRGASSDSKPFKQMGIPAITISGLGDDWRKFLHQDADQLVNINIDKVFENLLFSKEYLFSVDSKPCAFFRN